MRNKDPCLRMSYKKMPRFMAAATQSTNPGFLPGNDKMRPPATATVA
jgi:hypothetical protein